MSSERMIAMKTFTKAVAAGLMIDLGVAVYLSCPNKIAGSLLFSVALFCICSFKMNLFTGKIGYILQNRNDPNCLIIWLGNFVGCAGGAALLRLARPQLSEAAAELMAAKLRLSWPSVAILGFFCGLLMYLAVENYASNPSGAGKVHFHLHTFGLRAQHRRHRLCGAGGFRPGRGRADAPFRGCRFRIQRRRLRIPAQPQ